MTTEGVSLRATYQRAVVSQSDRSGVARDSAQVSRGATLLHGRHDVQLVGMWMVHGLLQYKNDR